MSSTFQGLSAGTLVLVALGAVSACEDNAHHVNKGADAGREAAAACEASEQGNELLCETLHVNVAVKDRTGAFPLAPDSVAFFLPGCDEPVACSQGSETSFRCEVPGNAAPTGRIELLAYYEGGDYRMHVALRGTDYPPDEKYCAYRTTLSLPLASCVDTDTPTLQGRVLGVAADADLHVNLLKPYRSDDEGLVWFKGAAIECETVDATYRCPTAAYEQEYVLWVAVGQETIAVRRTMAAIDGCKVRPFRYDVDPSACNAEVWLDADAEAVSAAELTVTLTTTGGGPVACHRVAADQTVFHCPVGAMQRFPTGTITVHDPNGRAITKNLLSNGAFSCAGASSLPLGFTNAPRFGLPTVFLAAAELRELGLSGDAD